MPVKSRAIDPEWFYTADELSAVTGLSAKQFVRMMDERRIGFHVVGAERGRRITGQQFLDWKASRRIEPEAGA